MPTQSSSICPLSTCSKHSQGTANKNLTSCSTCTPQNDQRPSILLYRSECPRSTEEAVVAIARIQMHMSIFSQPHGLKPPPSHQATSTPLTAMTVLPKLPRRKRLHLVSIIRTLAIDLVPNQNRSTAITTAAFPTRRSTHIITSNGIIPIMEDIRLLRIYHHLPFVAKCGYGP